jgi:hypothetical protein
MIHYGRRANRGAKLMKVAIVSVDNRIRRSLLMLLQSYPELGVSCWNEYAGDSIPDETAVVIMDIDSVLAIQDWPSLIGKHPVIFYSQSKEYAELVDWLYMYKADFFNVYTHPDCVLHLIEKAWCRSEFK